ncbi:hypothetical protein Pelo_10439 [Pelomyxa schiedti]|nr:hypothetical protein Pelo_10439 [Pelomyxa schiedti]
MGVVSALFVLGLCVSLTTSLGADWLPTPLGYAHSSCVHKVPSGSSAVRVGRKFVVTTPAGKTFETEECQYTPLMPTVAADGWQIWTTSTSTSSSYETMVGMFTVPDAPVTYDRQTLFLFPGLQNLDWVPGPDSKPAPLEFEIIQPVLQYGPSSGGGGKYWALASWYVTVWAGYLVTDLITVQPKENIWGVMERIQDNKWIINGTVMSTGKTAMLTVDKTDLATNPYAYVTFEAYSGTSSCSELPTAPQVYTQLALTEGQPPVQVEPSWVVHATSQPVCNEYASVESNTQVTLHFQKE